VTVPCADTLIVVPMKDMSRSKTRLQGQLTPDQRARLARLMLCKTLELLRQLEGVDSAVVTGSAGVAAIALKHGIRVIVEPVISNLCIALEHAARYAQAKGYRRVCILPADLASPAPGDLKRLLASHVSVTVCPAADYGTNALLVTPPCAVRFRYGPQSAYRHMDAAARVGLHAVWMPFESFSLDVDTSACLEEASEIDPEIQALIAVE